MNQTDKLSIALLGLATSVVPFSLRADAEGYEKGTRPLNKDEVISNLRTAADTISQLNSALMKAYQEIK